MRITKTSSLIYRPYMDKLQSMKKLKKVLEKEVGIYFSINGNTEWLRIEIILKLVGMCRICSII